jgi:hypothetical protein
MTLMPGTVWRPVPNHSGAMSAHLGSVMHSQEGYGSPFGWFSNSSSQASSTLWFAKDGTIEQYVDYDLMAWTQAAGNGTFNGWEFEGYTTEPLTDAQILTGARAYVFGRQTYGWPLQLSENPTTPGFAWHGMGGAAWGGHLSCPGDIRKAQRGAILWLAAASLAPSTPPHQESNMLTSTPSGNGYWELHADGSVWGYGDAQYFGGLNPGAPFGGGAMKDLGETAISIESHPGGEGYWVLSSSHHIFAFGAAAYHGASNHA